MVKKIHDVIFKSNVNKRVEYVYSSDPLRRKKIVSFENEEIDILISTTILERGVTFRDIDVYILDSTSKLYNVASLVQIAGRVGRKKGYETGEIYFLHQGISDDMKQSESKIKLMNEKAKQINMVNTNFSNSSGTFSQDNYSTVRDIALLSSYLINNYSQYYKYFKEKDFAWARTGGNPVKQENRNVLLSLDEGVDGIKTGHLKDSKYSIAVTKKKDNRRIIAVISGLPTMSSRAESSKLLLNGAFNKIDLVKIPYDKDKFKIKIWNGSSSYLDVKGVNKDGIFVNLPKNLKNPKIKMELEYEYPLQLPIKKFEKVAVLRIYKNKELIETEDLFAQKDITDKNIFFKGIQNINHYLWQ
mgnify:CR=1 FL=1